jgi:hypothetical protein
MNMRGIVTVAIVSSLLLIFGTATSAASVGFQHAASYHVGSAPVSVAAGDFNADGTQDLGVANAGDGTVSILLGNGDGTFKAATGFGACKNCNKIVFFVAAGDFNSDSKSDLAVVRPGNANASDNGDITIFLSNGDETFREGQVLTPAKNPSSLMVSDLNADHRLDLIVSNQTDNTVAILFGNEDGTFQFPVPYTTGTEPRLLSLVDIDEDGLQDVAVSRSGGADILWANGDGTFRIGPSVTTGASFLIVAWADFNQDRKIDYLVSGIDPSGKGRLSVALGNGDGTFQSTRTIPSLDLVSILVADFDGDGKLDVAGSERLIRQQVSMSLGNGDATFLPPANFTNTSSVGLGLATDVNSDKAPDLVTINGDSTISVLLNNGTDFSISASKPSLATVSRGQRSTSTVTITLLNAFDNPVALTCSVQPAGPGAPTCSMSPNSVTPAPNGSATATLTINTATAATLGLTPFAWLLAPITGLVGIAGSSRKSKRKLGYSLAGGVLFAGLLAQLACGSNGSPRAQTYTVSATGSSTFAEHSTTLTLAVQ